MGGSGKQAFARLYDEHFDAIFRYVLIRVGNVAEAEDIASETFFKALRGFWRLRWTGAPVSAWLYRIATNEVNSYFRGRRRRGRWEVGGGADGDAVARERETAEQQLQRDELSRQLALALRKLKPDAQALVVLRYFERKSFAEIARILRAREGTLAMRVHRALRKLRAELEQRGVDHEGIRQGLAEHTAAACAGVPADTAT